MSRWWWFWWWWPWGACPAVAVAVPKRRVEALPHELWARGAPGGGTASQTHALAQY